MMMSLPLIKRQSSILKRISGRHLWKRRCGLFKRIKLGGLAQLPKGKKAIRCKWVSIKEEGFLDKYGVHDKARMVAKGYIPKKGIDNNELFFPVVKHSSIKILLALVAQMNMEIVQLGVKTVFLYGDLEEEIYMTQPEGFKVVGKENMACKLKRSLYGLKQSPRQWCKRFDKFMIG